MAQSSRPCKGCGDSIERTKPTAPIQHYCGPDCRPRCSVEGCEKARHGKTYCTSHHSRWKRTGDPLTPLERKPNIGPCGVDGCDRPMRKTGLCGSHYAQSRRADTSPTPFVYTWAEPDSPCVVCGAKGRSGARRRHCSNACAAADSRHKGRRPESAVCTFCGDEFPLMRTATGRLQRTDTKWCPPCGRDSPEVRRFRFYGVTREQYQLALAEGCQICNEVVDTLHVDHDHSCCPGSRKTTCGKCVRGFLCGPCNRGIGLFFDRADVVRRAAAYLDGKPPMQ